MVPDGDTKVLFETGSRFFTRLRVLEESSTFLTSELLGPRSSLHSLPTVSHTANKGLL